MEKIKQFIDSDKGKDILVVIIVILVGLGSFELGRLSKENGSSGVKIQYNDQNTAQPEKLTEMSAKITNTSTATVIGKNFFASSRGSKYYSTSCSAGKNIKEANRIYFTTGEEAEAAGYALSSACQ